MVRSVLRLALCYGLLIALAAVASGLLAGVLTRYQVRLYEASAELLVRFGWEYVANPLSTEGWQPARMVELVNAEVRILNSRTVKAEALQGVGIEVVYPELARRGDDALEGAESILDRLRQLAADLNPPGTATPHGRPPLDRALALVDRDLNVRALGDSISVLVLFRHPDPEIARRFVASLLEAYQGQRARLLVGSEPEAARLRLDQAQAWLQAALTALDQYTADEDAGRLQQRLEVALVLAGSLDREAREAEARVAGQREIVDESGRYLAASRAIAGPVSAPGNLGLPPELEARMERYARNTALLALARDASTPESAALQILRQEEESLLSALRTFFVSSALPAAQLSSGDLEVLLRAQINARRELAGAEQAAARAKRALVALQPEIATLQRRADQYARLRAVVEAAAEEQAAALREVERARVRELLGEHQVSSVAVIDSPATPLRALGLGPLARVALGAILGAVLAGCIAAAIEHRRIAGGLP